MYDRNIKALMLVVSISVLGKTGEFSCTFDLDLCGFKHPEGSVLTWFRSDVGSFTGPYEDHTNGLGMFLMEDIAEKVNIDYITTTKCLQSKYKIKHQLVF